MFIFSSKEMNAVSGSPLSTINTINNIRQTETKKTVFYTFIF